MGDLIKQISNLDAEMSVLGACLIDESAFPRILSVLSPDDFYKKAHEKIYRALIEVFDNNNAIDVITVSDYLQKQGDGSKTELELSGGSYYLTQLVSLVPSGANVEKHAEIVKECSKKRKVRLTLGRGQGMIDDGMSSEDVLNETERDLLDVRKETTQSVFTVSETIGNTLDELDTIRRDGIDCLGLSSGFKEIDNITHGWQSDKLYILAGRPAMGKSALMGAFVYNLTVPSLVLSLEMSHKELNLRFLARASGINSGTLLRGRYSENDARRLTESAAMLSYKEIIISDKPAQTITEARAQALQMIRQHNIKMVFIDYLQLMRGTKQHREQEINEISQSLKAMSKEFHIPVMALSQLNRGVEARIDKRPMLSDLRESGAIEQDADVVMAVYRDEYYTKEKCDCPSTTELITLKNRGGLTGTVKLRHDLSIFKYTQITDKYTESQIPY